APPSPGPARGAPAPAGPAGRMLGLAAAGAGPGHEVIPAPLGTAAQAAVIEDLGARPAYVDVDPVPLTIAPKQIDRAVTRRTRAVLAVHFGGPPRAMPDVPEVRPRREL